MRIRIHQKIMLVFGGLLAIFTVIGVLTMSQINQLGRAIDVILRENYRSVIACQEMKESLERIDSGVLFTFADNQDVGLRFIEEYKTKFKSALEAELNNITLPGEGERARRLQSLYSLFIETIPQVIDNALPMGQREKAYFTNLWPMFQEIKNLSQEILEMNQKNMTQANAAARSLAESAHQRLVISMIFGWCVALLLTYMARFWILKPIHRLIESTNEIRRGNLDLVLETSSSDEIGQLSASFNEMTSALRQVRKTDRINLMRTRRATEEVFKALPEAIAIIDLDGRVEFSTETADRHFGLKPGITIYALGYEWLVQLVQQAQDEDQRAEVDSRSGYIQQFIDNREYFFQPTAVPISTGPQTTERTGTMLIFKDVTLIHEQQELKQGVVSTVSHQLKTPLTSLRMSIHLLLEEKVGALNEKQTELLMAAREESERLSNIVNNLLDLNRIKSDKITLTVKPLSPQVLARDGIEPFLYEAKDKGVAIINGVSPDLPDILVDPGKISQVFANILSNALRFTQPGGMVTVSAKTESDCVQFLIEDTGVGIAAKHLGQLFEPFYHIPEQDQKMGAGLGLAIVKEIIKAHGGKVGAESQVGKGSVFWFSLPVKEEASKN